MLERQSRCVINVYFIFYFSIGMGVSLPAIAANAQEDTTSIETIRPSNQFVFLKLNFSPIAMLPACFRTELFVSYCRISCFSSGA